jgi:hypothetical protein
MEIDMEATMELMVVPATVVQNDKPAKAKKAAVAVKPATTTAVVPTAEMKAETLVEMETKRQNWETTAYRTSNQQLYAVLADCLAYGRELPFADSKQRNKELETFLKSRDYRVKNDSPLLTRVVKAVFGNIDRRRISTYSLVLRTAQKEGVKPAELANWIEEKGGVQEVKLARSATYKSPKQKAEEAKSSLSELPTLAVAKERLSEFADADFVGSECVLLAEQQADGSFHIKALSRSGSAVNAALTALYGEQKKAAE